MHVVAKVVSQTMTRNLQSSSTLQLIEPNWPAPASVQAIISTRKGGHSVAPYHSANLGDHVGDDLSQVIRNRQILAQQTGIKHWQWLHQVHGTEVVHRACVNDRQSSSKITADGTYSNIKGQACSVLTADCLPVLLCDKGGSQVAAVHAGWRGLADGILNKAVQKFNVPGTEIMAYLGPAISSAHFEVGKDVYRVFQQSLGGSCKACFTLNPHKANHYFADLYQLAKISLKKSGLTAVFGSDFCTYTDKEQFFSYRRDGVTGRMVSAIWLK